jgi:hypothetical protein
MLSTRAVGELDTVVTKLMQDHIAETKSEIDNTERARFTIQMNQFWLASTDIINEMYGKHKQTLNLRHLESFIYSLREYLNNPEMKNSATGWDEVIKFLAAQDVNKLTFSGRIAFIRIRHVFYSNFFRPLVNLMGMSDELDTIIKNINEKKEITEEDSVKIQESLTKLNYVSSKQELTKEDMQVLQPAMTALLSVNLFTKINLIRLISERRLENYGEFYQKPMIGYPTLSNYILTLQEFNILNQSNLELTFLYFQKSTWRTARLATPQDLERLKSYGKEKHFNKYNDLFKAFISDDLGTPRDQKTGKAIEYVFNSEELQRINAAAEKDFSTALVTRIASDLKNSASESSLEEKVNENSEAISSMLITLHQGNAINEKNINSSILHANHIKHVEEAFRLFREVESEETPQETFDSLLNVSAQTEHIAALFKWLPEDQRTPELRAKLIENADYLEDLREVCEYELGKYVSKDKDNNDCSAAFIFNRNLHYNKEVLRNVRFIYQFFKENKIDNNHFVFEINNAVHLTHEIVSELKNAKDISVEGEDQALKMREYYRSIYEKCKENEMAARHQKIKHIASIPQLKNLFGRIQSGPEGGSSEQIHLFHNLAINFIDLVDSHFILYQSGLLDEWKDKDIIKFSPEYSVEIASALAELKTYNLLETKYVALIEKRREYATSIKQIIIKLAEWRILDKSLPSLEKNLFRAPALAREIIFMDYKTNNKRLLELLSVEEETALSRSPSGLFYHGASSASTQLTEATELRLS